MKEKDQKRLMHDLFYGIEGEEDSMSYLDMCLKGDGDFEGLFEVTVEIRDTPICVNYDL